MDVYTALAGAIGALYGPLHGGANEVQKEPRLHGIFDHVCVEFILIVLNTL